jgi:hypothetical protein
MPDTLVAWLTIGGSNTDQSRRQVAWPLDRYGWGGFIGGTVDLVAAKMREAGYRPRLVVHNPFGTLAGEVMQFDQRIHADQGVAGLHDRLPWLCQGFEAAWRRWMRRNPDAEVICYLGMLDGDPQFAALKNNGAIEQWLMRMALSIRPALDAGMNVGWDASADVEPTAPAYAAMLLIQSLGPVCYVEARPTKPHLEGWPVICIDTQFTRSDPEIFPDAAALGHLPNAKLGRTMLLVTNGTAQARATRITQHAKDGYDISVPHYDLDMAIAAMG